LDPTHISESYSTGKTLVCRTLEYLTLGDKNMGISSLQYSSEPSITPQVLKRKINKKK
jgi:hypothetical protein